MGAERICWCKSRVDIDMNIPLWFELLVDLPLCVISYGSGFDEATEIELFGAELDACHFGRDATGSDK